MNTEHSDRPIVGPISHSAFYKFVSINAPKPLIESLQHLAKNLLGSIVIAKEGINGVLAGTGDALDAFEHAVTDGQFYQGVFRGMVFKRSQCRTNPFARLKIRFKTEIVASGMACINAVGRSGNEVTPQQWRALLSDENVVVIDNRNSFEFRLGRFKAAADPKISNFRDFSHYVALHAPKWVEGGKKVAMYCTGGIRCEKTSAWMQDLGIDVYQLQGGILNYFQTMADADRDWEGECFVFDNRIALNTRLEETDTTAEVVYSMPEDEWRLARARRLDSTE